jgi:hypothetical protein
MSIDLQKFSGGCEGPVPLHDYNSVLLYKRAIKPRLVT